MGIKFTFTWDPDRDPAIRARGRTLDRFIGWTEEMEENQISPSSIDISDFIDDMRRFLEGLGEGFPEGFTQEARDDHQRQVLEALERDHSLNDEGTAALALLRLRDAERPTTTANSYDSIVADAVAS